MEPTIFKFIFRYSTRAQLILIAISMASFPFLYFSLNLPKKIINDAIGGSGFPRVTFGFELEQIPYLMVLCVVFLILVMINGWFKYSINVYQGQMGERMLRRLRYMLYSRILRFPQPHFRKVSQGEMISMITAEVEPLGGFIGDAVALPVYQGGVLITLLFFIFVQDPIIGLAAIALYPVQGYIIPKMQSKVNALGKLRVQAVRQVSQRMSETVSGMEEVHAHDTAELELADMSTRLGRIFDIRLEIYQRKFFIKFLNNFIGQVTPFFFYSLGGYMVITGQLTFGALVAVLAAYKDLAAPWKELLRYYQMKEDSRIKYEQLIDQFQPMGMLDEELQRQEPETPYRLEGPIVATNVVLDDDGGIKVVDGVTFSLPINARTAILGPSGAGRAGVAQMLSRIVSPTAGAIRYGERLLANLPEAVTGRRLAYVGPAAYIFSGSIADNLFYGLKHRVRREAEYEGAVAKARAHFAHEAEASGNTLSDFGADWVDLDAAGAADAEELTDIAIKVLGAVDMADEVFELGLQGNFDPKTDAGLAERVLEARNRLHDSLADPKLAKLVAPFDRQQYNHSLTVAENVLFGTPIGDTFGLDHIGENDYVLSVLEKVGIIDRFRETGLQLASVMVELFQDLPSDHEFFERYSFIAADALPEFQRVVRHAENQGLDSLETSDRNMLISLPFKLIPARHQLGLIDDELEHGLLEARRVFQEDLPDDLASAVAFYDRERYNAAASVQDNILFGRIVYGRPQAQQEVGKMIRGVVEELDLRRAIMRIGLDQPVGLGGGRLSPALRQKLALGRALIKRPDLLIINGATAALDPASQRRVMDNLFKAMDGCGIVWIISDPAHARRFGRALVMENGKVVEQGTRDELDKPGTKWQQFIEAGEPGAGAGGGTS